ncbi:L-proline trans-4-hydroxylase-like isoform X2 [Ruditapes philippinarum]|uniref:L-proline trans-4-hydroxylase-like isoform X2 n=1 Tax=Ruditapes philippinarum TaxID=129788 RepID=UPI00295B2377|nr:L-proline trans-4-hydroxylase-like isoform X2 [Ruditapes philippinarum]
MSAEYKYDIDNFEVSNDMKKNFDKDGYTLIRNLFSKDEVHKIEKTITEGGMMKHSYMLLGVEELYHYHCKFLIKEPKVGGSFEWHQDYGYWYNYCLSPDMLAVFIAVDECTQENGGLVVLRGTHKCGRVDHGKTGGQQGADIERVELLKKQYELVNVDLQPGDVLFFHCNLLHCSGPNNSEKRRLAINVSYNEKSNSPVKPDICPEYTKLEKVSDTAILECQNYTDFSGKNFIKRGDDKLVDFADQTSSYEKSG